MPIKKLPHHLIRQIAAGEVIDRPYSVVKELLENALDSGATQIEIQLDGAGLDLIKVIDNGQGMNAEDLGLVFERYATSKLSEADDLLHIHTLGFRGEALFAISSVAEVTVLSRTAKEKVGNEIQSIRGKVQPILPKGHQKGTTVMVSDLFGNMPVRKKTIQPRKEVRDILQLIEGYSLEFPAIAFQLTHQGKIIWTSFSNETYADRLYQTWKMRNDHGKNLNSTYPYTEISGWISTPQYFVNHRKHMFCFINHRIVDPQIIFPSIASGLKTFSHRGLFPQFHISLQIPAELVDINLHPQKKKVKFLHEQEIFSYLQTTISEAFQETPTNELRYVGQHIFPDVGVRETTATEVTGEITQIHNLYLLVPTNHGFLLIDQHAADEKLWYNRLLKDEKVAQKLRSHIDEETRADFDDDEYFHSFHPDIDAEKAVLACHQAIRAGQTLNQAQMQKLVKDLLAAGTESLTCPHGRPTQISISLNQLAHLFRR